MRCGVRVVLLAGVVVGPGGCSEEELPPLRWETERTLVGSEIEGLELCSDDFAMLDEHVSFVEDMLGVEREGKVEIYFYDLDGLPCSVSPTGCYRRDTDQIHMATWDGVDHELVHAVARDRAPSLFWDEGVADALRWVGTLGDGADVVANSERTSPETLDYMNARHFVRWFIETYGGESLRRVVAGETEEQVTGKTLEELAAEHQEATPYAYPTWPQYICPYPELGSVGDGEWYEEFDLECNESGATGIGGVGGVSTVRTVDLDPGRYRMLQQGGSFTSLLGCQLTANEGPLPEMFHGAAFNEAELSRKPPQTFYAAGEEHLLEVTRGGRFRMLVGGGSAGPLEASIELARVD